MSRIQVKTTATATILRFTAEDGRVVREATPRQLYELAGSIGAYVVAPMPGKPHVWGFWRVSGAEKHRILDGETFVARVRHEEPLPEGVTIDGRSTRVWTERVETPLAEHVRQHRDPERVAVNGRSYLLATSPGSARRGILHAVRRGEGSPLEQFLRSRGISPSIITREGGDKLNLTVGARAYDYAHCPNGRLTMRWVTDGKKEVVESTSLEEPHGYFGGGSTSVIRITDATYAIGVAGRGGGWDYAEEVSIIHLAANAKEDGVIAFLRK